MKWAEGTPLTAWLWWIIVHSNLSEGVCPCYLLLSGTQCSYMCTQTINVCKSFMVLIRAFLCIAYRRREKNEANLCLRQRRNNRQLSRQLGCLTVPKWPAGEQMQLLHFKSKVLPATRSDGKNTFLNAVLTQRDTQRQTLSSWRVSEAHSCLQSKGILVMFIYVSIFYINNHLQCFCTVRFHLLFETVVIDTNTVNHDD